MPDFFGTNNSGLSNEIDNVHHTKKIPRDWLHPNKLNEEHVKTVYSRELTAITCEEERNSFIEQELQKMKYHQKHIKVIGRDYANTTMLAFLREKGWKSAKGTIISNQKQMHVAITTRVKKCDTFEDLFQLLQELYTALYTSQDNINKTWVKIKRRKNLEMNDLRWDFQAAKQYMQDNYLEYIETGESMQRDCIKNLIVKGKHQYIGCFNTFLKKHTGFSFSIARTGSKSKLEYGELKLEFLTYSGKGKDDDMGPVSAWNLFKESNIINECPDDDDSKTETENETDDETPAEEVISRRKAAVQEFSRNLNRSTKKQKKDTDNEEQAKDEVTSSAKMAVRLNLQDITTTQLKTTQKKERSKRSTTSPQKKKKKRTKKNEKCDAQHDDHNNYTKIIENPKDCGEDTMRFGMTCFFCKSEFRDKNPDNEANIVVPGKNKHMCYSCQNFKEPFWCMHGICAQCKQLKIKEDIQNTTQSSRVTRTCNSL